jgi:quinol monooxygenase YgiN
LKKGREMIVSTLRMVTSPANRTEILQNLTSLLGRMKVQPGCTACHLYEDIEEQSVIMLTQEWESQDDLNNHLRSDDYGRILATIELSESPPELHFDDLSSRRGLEIVETARLRSGRTLERKTGTRESLSNE